MTVDEMITELQKISDDGGGERNVVWIDHTHDAMNEVLDITCSDIMHVCLVN